MARLAKRVQIRQDRKVTFSILSPAAAYLATLAPGSASTQAAELKALAALLRHPDPDACPWHELGWHQVAALRQQFASRYAPATANRLLAALRGTLLAARRAGLIGADDYARLTDVRPIHGQADVPPCRAGGVIVAVGIWTITPGGGHAASAPAVSPASALARRSRSASGRRRAMARASS